jgi:DNA-binding transcriptional ArsR family regulator
MKRDMDLVRKILLAVEASERPLDSSLIRIAGYTGESITEHMRLLNEAGLIEGISAYSVEHRLKWIELRLTWNGHDFLDAARSESVWNETVTEVRKKTGAVPFEVLKGLLLDVARDSVRPAPELLRTRNPFGRGGSLELREQPT